LRLVGIFDSALLALRRVVAFDADAACSGRVLYRLLEHGCNGILEAPEFFRRRCNQLQAG
jgi:hypothetical protein